MEKKIEKYLTDKIHGLGGMCIKFPPLFYVGFPDRIVLMPGGVIVFVELKAPGKKPRAVQEKVHARLRGLCFRVEVIDSVEGINDFILTL